MSWLTNWKYRVKIHISDSSTAESDFQILLKIGESAGASNYHFHLSGYSSNFPSDKGQGGDLRFTASDGQTHLPFWVEKVSGTTPNRTAKIWVRVSENLTQPRDIYCYFGNSSASNASSIEDTFLVGDDFANEDTRWLDTGVSGSKSWVTLDGNDCIKLDGPSSSGNKYVVVNAQYVALGNGLVVESKIKFTSEGDISLGLAIATKLATQWYEDYYGINSFGYGNTKVCAVTDGSYQCTDYVGSTKWYIEKAIVTSSEVKAYLYDYENGNLEASVTKSCSPPSILFPKMGTYNIGYFDYIIVRKYADPEPGFQSAEPIESFSKLTGTACDKYGNTITGQSVKVFILDKENGIKIGQTTSDSNGNWSCDVWTSSNTKVITVLTLEDEYLGDTDIAGAEFNTTQEVS